MLEKIARCHHCGREMTVGPLAAIENPYCSQCLHERLASHSSWNGPMVVREHGHYLELVPGAKTKGHRTGS